MGMAHHEMDTFSVQTVCRCCGLPGLRRFLSLGRLPLANGLLFSPDQVAETYPLDMVFCPYCALVQITGTVAPAVLYGSYLYFSSYSDPLLINAAKLTERLICDWELNEHSLVYEIGSNDGYLLKNYAAAGIPVLGIEPAQSVAAAAIAAGVPTLRSYFSEELARRLKVEYGPADVIHANNVLAHIADLNGAVAGIAHLLKDDGLASIEVHYVKDLIDNTEFDTIYHEHLCYFSATSLNMLFKRHGLVLLHIERTTTHGGTLRCFVGKNGRSSAHVSKILQAEQTAGLHRYDYYRNFGARVRKLGETLTDLLANLKKQDKRIVGYGAPAKATILLNMLGIGRETLDYVVDSTPAKQGRYIPGCKLPIFPSERVLADMPDYALLLVWNFADVVLKREAAYREQGGKFIVPIPEVKIV